MASGKGLGILAALIGTAVLAAATSKSDEQKETEAKRKEAEQAMREAEEDGR